MSGFQEILLIVAIVFGIIFVPRMLPKRPEVRKQPVRPPITVSTRLRAVIVASIVYSAIVAIFFPPWLKEDLAMFCYVGIGPVALCWLVAWVFAGLKRNSK